MSSLTINNVRIAGMSACVPHRVEENLSLDIFIDETEAIKVIDSTGIERRHVVDEGTTASDLASKAIERIISDLGWEKSSIDLLVYVCQSRDYIAPQTACILQDRIGLSQDCCVFDMPVGCSGFVHGMSVAASMLSHGGLKRGLLVNAETNSINRNMKDRTVRPLFGDAATVTALEFCHDAYPMNFVFGVDGSGYQSIWTKYGGMRFPTTIESLREIEVKPGIIRKGTDMVVKGMDVFAFAIKQPPKSIKNFMDIFSINIDEIDLLVLHQANKYIDEKIRKSLKIPADKVPYCLQDFGNVTSASIPLTLVTQRQSFIQTRKLHCLACGFGVGLQWGTMDFYIDNIVCPDLIFY